MSDEIFDEEEEPLPCEEEEDEEDDEIVSDDEPDPDYIADLSRFQQVVSTYNAFIYQYPASILSPGVVALRIPSNFLPLAQQSVYGFNVDPTLLEIKISLDDFQWNRTPTSISCVHPVYGRNFVGYALVTQQIADFFSSFYKPQKEYKSATYLLSADSGFANEKHLQKLVSDGFEEQRAQSALILSHNNIDIARNFLRTGEAPPLKTEIKVRYADSPLIYFVLEMCELFLDLSDHCCLCRAPLLEATVRPFACNKAVCQMAFSEMGVGTSLLQEIRRDPAAADLLISCFGTALKTPFSKPSPPFLDQGEIAKIFDALPSVNEIANQVDDKGLLDFVGPKTVQLLRWIILSNNSQFISLPNELRLPEFNSRFQFLTLMSSEEKEMKFRALKAKYGSLFLWHGSAGERWHSIIRNGLKNATGTSLQANGAALGAGIYFARDLNTSSGYSRSSVNGYKRSTLGSNLQLVGLCEVAKVPELKDHQWAHTCVNEDCVVVRFLLVSANGSHDTINKPPRHIPQLLDVLDYHATHPTQYR